jgi:putative hydrolase of the HAD superfamily
VRTRPDALVLDLDGVLRHFDPAVLAEVEAAVGLDPGSVLAAAFERELLQPALLGQLTHEQWAENVAAALVDRHGIDKQAARRAVDGWLAYHGAVDADVLAFVEQVRAAGVPVGLATNATSRLDADLAALGLSDAVDAVVNSSVVGVHKPTKEFFREVCAALNRPPDRCLFVDDDDRNVRGARAAGLSAYRWNGPADLPYLKAVFGV